MIVVTLAPVAVTPPNVVKNVIIAMMNPSINALFQSNLDGAGASTSPRGFVSVISGLAGSILLPKGESVILDFFLLN